MNPSAGVVGTASRLTPHAGVILPPCGRSRYRRCCWRRRCRSAASSLRSSPPTTRSRSRSTTPWLANGRTRTTARRSAIERGEWRSYKITYAERSTTRTFQANLAKIGTVSFLDLTEMRGADPGPFLVPVHGVLRISVDGDRLTASLLDYPWFMRAIDAEDAARDLGRR